MFPCGRNERVVFRGEEEEAKIERHRVGERGERYPVSESARFLPVRTVNGDNSFSDGLIFNGEFVESERGRGKKEKKRGINRGGYALIRCYVRVAL